MDRLSPELEHALTVFTRLSAQTPDGEVSYRGWGDTFRSEGVSQNQLRALANRGLLRKVFQSRRQVAYALSPNCEPTAHRFFPSDSASFRFRRFRPTAHRRVLCRPIPLLAILP